MWPSRQHPGSPDASSPFGDISPAEVRAALTPESAAEFDRQWRAALARATDSLDLTEVVELLTGLGPQGSEIFKSVQHAAPVLLRTATRIEALSCCQFLALLVAAPIGDHVR